MDAAVIAEIAGGSAGGLSVTGLSRWIYVRSRARHQVSAQDALRSASEVSLDLEGAINTVKIDVADVTGKLGPGDAASFSKKAGSVIAKAETASSAYLSFAAADDGSADPFGRVRRGRYMRMGDSYRKHEKILRKQLAAVTALSAECSQLSSRITTFETQKQSVESWGDAAKVIIGTRRAEGWNVASLQSEHASAQAHLSGAVELAGSNEFLRALKHLDLAQKGFQSAEKLARSLPERQKEFEANAAAAERNIAGAGRELRKAQAAIKVVQAAYADSCSANLLAELAGARERHSHLGELVAELRDHIRKDSDSWDEAEQLLTEIGGIFQEIRSLCQKIGEEKSRLDTLMQKLRDDVRKLDQRISKVQSNIAYRDGNQRGPREALAKADAQLDAFTASLSSPRPDPVQLDTELSRIEELVTRINKWSYAIDDGDYDSSGFLKTAVVTAAAVIGIDFLFD